MEHKTEQTEPNEVTVTISCGGCKNEIAYGIHVLDTGREAKDKKDVSQIVIAPREFREGQEQVHKQLR